MIIAVFDFDGTITSKDTFLEFIKFSKGIRKFWSGLVILSPVLLLYITGILNNGKAKQIVFRFFFRGMPVKNFNSLCVDFSLHIDRLLNTDALKAIETHQRAGDKLIITSASIENWIKPWAEKMGINEVLATKIEIDPDGILTGRFLTANCYGQEKKNRLLEAYPDRSKYTLYVYGDSRGDKAMMEFADHSYYKCFE